MRLTKLIGDGQKLKNKEVNYNRETQSTESQLRETQIQIN